MIASLILTKPMQIMKFKNYATLAAITLIGVASSQATVLYSSDGSDASGYTGGIAVINTTPFNINGSSQGDYFDSSSYPFTTFTAVDASAAGSQEMFVGFLLRRNNQSAWAGGILLGDGTDPAGLAGWHSNANTVTLYNGNEGGAAAGGFSLAADTDIAVMARYYENGTSGVFDRADLYIDSDLSDGVDFSTALISGYDASAGANALINRLRLNADPAGSGEHRYYDNVVISTTQQEAANFVSGVPEPSSAALLGLGGLALILRRRK